jgi:hypothetical protein
MESELQDLLAVAFPPSSDAEVIRGVTEGVLLADDLTKNTPMLKHLGGYDLRGHLRRVGIMFRLHDLSDRGDLPFATEIAQMPHGPWHWLEIKSKNFRAHVCRTEGQFDFPDDTLSRQDERLRNQPDLFDRSVAPLHQIAKNSHQLYSWLTFGADRAGKILHICWAMPPADQTGWLAHINVIGRATSHATSPIPHATTPKRVKLEFREHVLSTVEKKQKDKS